MQKQNTMHSVSGSSAGRNISLIREVRGEQTDEWSLRQLEYLLFTEVSTKTSQCTTLRDMGYNSRTTCQVPLLDKNRNVRLQCGQANPNWTVQDIAGVQVLLLQWPD